MRQRPEREEFPLQRLGLLGEARPQQWEGPSRGEGCGPPWRGQPSLPLVPDLTPCATEV